jgi:hypothetical protein
VHRVFVAGRSSIGLRDHHPHRPRQPVQRVGNPRPPLPFPGLRSSAGMVRGTSCPLGARRRANLPRQPDLAMLPAPPPAPLRLGRQAPPGRHLRRDHARRPPARGPASRSAATSTMAGMTRCVELCARISVAGCWLALPRRPSGHSLLRPSAPGDLGGPHVHVNTESRGPAAVCRRSVGIAHRRLRRGSPGGSVIPVAASGEANRSDDGDRCRPSQCPPTEVRHVVFSSLPLDVTMALGRAKYRLT